MDQLILKTRSADETELIGACLGRLLGPGDIVTLSGDLGGGKTCITRGIVSSAAPQSIGQVASPTFAIMNEYAGKTTIYHFDFYRLRGVDDCIELGFDEYMEGDGICLIEWPERVSGLIRDNFIEVRLEDDGNDCRTITFRPHGKRAESIINQISLHR